MAFHSVLCVFLAGLVFSSEAAPLVSLFLFKLSHYKNDNLHVPDD